MPKLVRLYITQIAIGFAISALFTVALIGFDVAGLRHLVLETRDGPLAAFMIFFFNGIVFGGVQFAIAVMALRDDGTPRSGLREMTHELLPVRVETKSENKRRF
ncbi:hypothetical protein [Pseudooceanicola algae]|uniref:Uncharacterized protein n=1 Tax=Pseudooceanicola algae TaxID=1537215 RepID=A0A418SCH1_9RHOB|nr:hypothetical protein [Pseudooceanicola algae]QPM90071.1 hypothetical protein PSAL_013050 [Pseudooceanicola algae]